ncbi:SNF2 family amino-terminal protein [Rhizoctonia solani]|uniref:SNF2 family amino-terminal protein n=1 Tax=Rhizoctonia solani TaxID=456999 RepID=A0A8H8NQQ2_9AGAM|nr:SNF2 family amino-terminal protein [Rhizoctonia solani]QRW16628.1 SNF2 family amino-terminal protein [Rhizoctonia solani]
MPLTPVAHSVLYLFEAAAMNESHPLTCPPWTSNVWRELFGLFPLKGSEDYYDAEIDVVGDSDPQLDSSKELGLTMPESSIASITENRRRHLGSMSADYVRKIPIRETIKSTTRGEKGGPDPYGYAAYRNLVLAAINRKGGVMNQVEETLGKIGATPADLWKDDRSLNRERPATKRVLEHQVPIADTHARLEERDVQAALARALFGDAGVSSRGTVVPELIPTIRCFAQRKYENLARSLKRKVTTSCARMQKVDSKLEDAQRLRSPKALRDATRALTDWRKIAIGTKEVDELHFLSRERTLKQLWSSLGFGSLEDDLTASKSKSKSTQDGPSEEEMQAAYAYYVEEYCYGVGCLDESELPIPTVGVSGLHSLVDGCKDIGVSHLKSLSTEALWAQLGLPGVDQFPFAEPGTGESAKDMAPLAKTRARVGDCAQPTLLCDNVGLGKTVQIIGVISMIQHYYKQQELPAKERLATPMFIQEQSSPYFAGQKTIPNLPSIVITPRTLGNQWMEQWKKFTQLGSFVPVRYSVESGTLESFCSDPTGPYRAAAGRDLEHAGRVVIIADLSAIAKEAKRCLQLPPAFKGKDAREYEAKGETPAFKAGISNAGSLFGMRFRVAAVDEIHNLRNSSHTQRGVQLITQSSSLVIGATATPLFTSLKCLLALGRNLRYQPLLGEQGVQVWNKMQEMLSTGNESWRLTSTAVIQATVERELQAALLLGKIPLYDPRAAKIKEELESKYQAEDQRSILHMIHVSKQPLNMLRLLLLPIMIRCTNESLDYLGRRILDLPFVQKFIAWAPMNEEEKEMQRVINQEHTQQKSKKTKLAQKAKAAKRQKRKQAQDNVGDNEDEDVDENAWNGSQAQGEVERSDCKNVRWHNFLIEQKFAGMLAKLGALRLEEQAQELDRGTLTNKVTDDWTVENLPQKMSTRMQCVMGLIEWFWIGNPKPVALLEDGTLDKARLVQEPLPSKKPRKFLIYVEFQQHQALIAKMLTLKEKDYVTYNGSMATTKRQRSVEKFANDPSCRIMIISNVGSAGLNLVEASVVIIVSSVWSGLELDQIMGCVDRPGQLRDVAVYNIMAPEGIDLALNVYADSKAQLSNHFLSSQRTLQTVYLEIAQPHSNDHDELDLEEIPAVPSTKGTKPSTSKAGPRKRKSQNEQYSQDANAVQKLALAKALGSQVSGAPSSNLVPTTQSMQPLPTLSTGSTEQTDELLISQGVPTTTPNAIGGRTMVASSQQKTKFHAKKARLGHSSSDPSWVAAATTQPSQPLSATGPILVPAKKRTAPSMDPPSSMPTRTDPAASGSSSRQAPIVPRPSGSAQPRAATATLEQLLQLQPGSSSTAPTTSGHSVVTGGGSSQRKVFRLKASKLSASNHSVDAKK